MKLSASYYTDPVYRIIVNNLAAWVLTVIHAAFAYLLMKAFGVTFTEAMLLMILYTLILNSFKSQAT